jgi:hypothetical protein
MSRQGVHEQARCGMRAGGRCASRPGVHTRAGKGRASLLHVWGCVDKESTLVDDYHALQGGTTSRSSVHWSRWGLYSLSRVVRDVPMMATLLLLLAVGV